MKLGWLKMLKNSARNWAVSLSLNFQPLVTDKSKLRMPESRKLLRGDVPKVPKAGGIKTE